MAKNTSNIQEELAVNLVQDVEMIKLLMILLVDKMGVTKKEIAKALGISQGRLSQILNPGKYKNK